MPLAGRPMIEWSIAAFRACPSVGSIVVACPRGYLNELSGSGVVVVQGGATRAESVFNALEAVDTELVAVHDAARPLVTPELIEDVIAALVADPSADGAIPATRAVDTTKWVSVERGSLVVDYTLMRDRVRAAQTPQVFNAIALGGSLASAIERPTEPTDDASAVELGRGKVLVRESPAENFKVTTPLDLKLAELVLAERGQ